jgi:hypothetical protein
MTARDSQYDAIEAECARRGVARLCHFTQVRTLFKIAQGKAGILSSKELAENSADIYKPTDSVRYDGLKDHVCCSVQFPNAYYLEKARAKDPVFRDWVVLFINPRYLWQLGTKFSPVNAAKGRGAFIAEGKSAFLGLFAPRPKGSDFSRSPIHRDDSPTDLQAEVLVPDRIDITDITGVCFESVEQARDSIACLEIGGVATRLPPVSVCSQLFDPNAVRTIVRNGALCVETIL